MISRCNRYSRIPLLTLLLLPIVLTVGCRQEDAPEDTAPAPQAETLSFEPIGQGYAASLQDTVEAVIRDSATWAAYRQQLRPSRPFASVDFSQAMVLLAAIPVSSGGYHITFESVEQTDSTIVTAYVFAEPDDDCLTAIGRAVPFQAVQVRRASGPVRFERHHDRYRCTTR